MKLNRKFWTAMVLFGLIGQVAWVVENMYLNVFLYQMFHASAADISRMVGASAVSAAVTTVLMGTLSDRVGKRKAFLSGGYVLWGLTILLFGLVRMDRLEAMTGSVASAAGLGILLVIVLDCVMTFFGSTANDACFNAWLTDRGGEGSRGKIEGINAMMPLVSILVVFGGFMGFDLSEADSWTTIFFLIGGVVLVSGVLGFFLIEEPPMAPAKESYWQIVIYSFRPSVFRANRRLYGTLALFALFNISIQIFMPYLILYYEQSLGMSNYVLIMAPAIVLASVATALYGKVYDRRGYGASALPCLALLAAGYVLLYLTRATLPVFVGSLLMMCGYLMGMSVFGARIRSLIPENRAGQFQGVRIIGQVLIPGVIGPAIGAWVLRNAEQILNNDGTYSFLPNANIFAAALIPALAVGLVLAVSGRKERHA